MKAILSCTADDLYLFNLPFAIHSWHMIGVDCMIFVPEELIVCSDKFKLILQYLPKMERGGLCWWLNFTAPEEKVATYAQCARLYAAASRHCDGMDVLITSDADMCVFNQEYWDQFDCNGWINIIGSDLVPDEQVPMCYISMPRAGWEAVMQINGRTYQQCLDDLLGGVEAENFRGNYWAKDQETAHDYIAMHKNVMQLHPRAHPGTQFATRRADRDGWVVTLDIIDAHLPRPGYAEGNFNKIYGLFRTMYPMEDYTWMFEYVQAYVKLMQG